MDGAIEGRPQRRGVVDVSRARPLLLVDRLRAVGPIGGDAIVVAPLGGRNPSALEPSRATQCHATQNTLSAPPLPPPHLVAAPTASR